MTTITINSARPAAKGPRYGVDYHGPGAPIGIPVLLTHTSFRLLLILALKNHGDWVGIDDLAGYLTSRYIYRLCKDLGLPYSEVMQNNCTKEYRLSVKVRITRKAFEELATFPDVTITSLIQSDARETVMR